MSDLQLEEFFVQKLSVVWIEHTEAENDSTQTVNTGFDYEIALAEEDSRRRRMILRIKFSQISAEKAEIGYQIGAEIAGYLRIDPSDNPEKDEVRFRVNGVSFLYGALRGLVAVVTGSFPGGKFNIPTILPFDVVKAVEERRAKSLQSSAQGSNEPSKPESGRRQSAQGG
ncbi:MAG: hypothetical protein AB7O66_11605 [Limisphaerales bacterium]